MTTGAESVKIEVTDTGPGVPEELSARIFTDGLTAKSPDTRRHRGNRNWPSCTCARPPRGFRREGRDQPLPSVTSSSWGAKARASFTSTYGATSRPASIDTDRDRDALNVPGKYVGADRVPPPGGMAPRLGDMGQLTDKPELIMHCLSIRLPGGLSGGREQVPETTELHFSAPFEDLVPGQRFSKPATEGDPGSFVADPGAATEPPARTTGQLRTG